MRARKPLTEEQRLARNAREAKRQRDRYRHNATYRGKRIVENRARYGHVPRGTVKQHEYIPAILEWIGLA